MSVASRLAGLPAAAVGALKRALHAAAELPLDQGLEVERRMAQLVAARDS